MGTERSLQEYFIALLIMSYQPIVHAGSHSLSYYFSAEQTPCPYTIAKYVDDVLIARYSSVIGQVVKVSVCQWLQDPEDLQVQETTKLAQEYEATHRKTLQDLRKIFNQSSDAHVYQIKFGCELYDDGSIDGYMEFGLNGKEIIFFDKESLMYIPATREAQILAQGWNSDRSNALEQKILIEHNCLNRIKSYIHHGKQDLEKQVPPQVKVSRRPLDSTAKLYCQVYGFYPQAVHVKWLRDEQDEVISGEASRILPHPDGTYQVTATVEVTAGEENRYSCHVDHSSLEETLSVRWEAKMTDGRRRYSMCIVSSLFMAMLICLVGILRKTHSLKSSHEEIKHATRRIAYNHGCWRISAC